MISPMKSPMTIWALMSRAGIKGGSFELFFRLHGLQANKLGIPNNRETSLAFLAGLPE